MVCTVGLSCCGAIGCKIFQIALDRLGVKYYDGKPIMIVA